jgi:hypothetical protein
LLTSRSLSEAHSSVLSGRPSRPPYRAGQAETDVYDLQASLTDGEDTEPAPAGTYRFEVCLDWTLEGKGVEKVLDGQFEVASGN